MPFIIEGPNTVGKTTLAGEIQKLVPRSFYSHMSTPPEGWDYDHDYALRAQAYAIQDRFHLGGIVYGDVCRGGTHIGLDSLRRTEAFLTLMGSFTLVMYDSSMTEELVLKRFQSRGRDGKYDARTTVRVNYEFMMIAQRTHSLRPHVDVGWDIMGGANYPRMEHCLLWAQIWQDRNEAAGRFRRIVREERC